MTLTLGKNPKEQMTIFWDSVPNATSYNIKICDIKLTEVYVDTTVTTSKYILQDLPENNMEFMVEILAIDKGGKVVDSISKSISSPISRIIWGEVVPNPPTSPGSTFVSAPTILNSNLSGTLNSVTAAWTSSLNRFDIRFENGAIQRGSSNFFTATGLSASTQFSFSVRAVDLQGNVSQWVNRTLTTLALPPTNVTTSSTTTSITINWGRQATATNHEYEIEFNGAYPPRNAGNSNNHAIHSLSPNTSHSFRMRTINASGSGPWSASQFVSTLLPTPSGFEVSDVSTNNITLQWNAVSGATSYIVVFDGVEHTASVTSRRIDNLSPGRSYQSSVRAVNFHTTSTLTSRAVMTLSNAPTNITHSAGIHSVDISWTAQTGATNYEIEFNGATPRRTGNVTSYRIQNLQPGTTHNYRMRSINSAGSGPWSSMRAVNTNLAPPTNIRATSVTTNSATLAWNAAVNATSYDITLNDITHNITGTSWTSPNNLSPGRNQNFIIRSRNTLGISEPNNISVLTLSAPPTNINNTPTTNSIALSWTAQEGATSYEMDINGTRQITNLTRHTFGVLQSGTAHNVMIRSINPSGVGPFSEVHIARTSLAAPANFIATSVNTNNITIGMGCSYRGNKL